MHGYHVLKHFYPKPKLGKNQTGFAMNNNFLKYVLNKQKHGYVLIHKDKQDEQNNFHTVE